MPAYKNYGQKWELLRKISWLGAGNQRRISASLCSSSSLTSWYPSSVNRGRYNWKRNRRVRKIQRYMRERTRRTGSDRKRKNVCCLPPFSRFVPLFMPPPNVVWPEALKGSKVKVTVEIREQTPSPGKWLSSVQCHFENLYFTMSMIARQINHKLYKNKAYNLTKT